ncbi:hypothetical protein PGTUg99_032807 [Puccinia graminis f. sp. tritici]|uniref:Uncharacterized protein n=1 Tax=Puccinia graminis f. sp. tritici TaxID=56615 RepID=A0A5B0RHQ7_PUCGR|nr:hypothetical protein PGTUg99_032807 [Puccinia graminis f. sp. tritici]
MYPLAQAESPCRRCPIGLGLEAAWMVGLWTSTEDGTSTSTNRAPLLYGIFSEVVLDPQSSLPHNPSLQPSCRPFERYTYDLSGIAMLRRSYSRPDLAHSRPGIVERTGGSYDLGGTWRPANYGPYTLRFNNHAYDRSLHACYYNLEDGRFRWIHPTSVLL